MKKIKKELQNILNTSLQSSFLLIINLFIILVLSSNHIFCQKNYAYKNIEVSENLTIIKISKHSFIHISYIALENGVRFPCNGFLYINDAEAYIFDTPVTDKATLDLINWVRNGLKISIKGVVFNHFHTDCTEGIDILKQEKIPSIASEKTRELMSKEGYPEPEIIFKNHLELRLGDKIIYNSFFGEAHSPDNIVSYFPDEEILFGGCMVKSIDAKKGNLGDANTSEWSHTISKIKKTYPDLKIIIPGHGSSGDQQLLDYTITLFKTKK
ncbi:subclass B1 metallo-beta-lactamase [Aquimarina sp. RZ0]|uniref:subclass B1 metallo-beta-lactamase n=1 Tax=Aquimarina sp. RZ0 TaxID=2607730 RepID=UPI0011F0FB69|nr:subclass B1 metallo-beta-lactamase [Aquimarina sp. RZ0]KAA1248090.1 subclass B1 metallo-beta-lactamase [Aquimarina sp. RZ0]